MGIIGIVWKNVDSVVVNLFPSEFYSSISSSNRYISPAYFSLHFETRKVLGPNAICVLERSKPVVLQISKVVGQTLLLSLFHFLEDWLYGYNIQRSLQRDQCLWLSKIYLHRVRYSRNGVFNNIEIITFLLYLTQCRYIYTRCSMEHKVTNLCVGTPAIWKDGGHHILLFRVFYT